jgi:hypothetical protein
LGGGGQGAYRIKELHVTTEGLYLMTQTILCEAFLMQQIFKDIFLNAKEDSIHVKTDRQMER